MAALIRENPQQALAEGLTPRQYAALPDDVKSLVERPVAAEGFFGVQAICSHGEEEGHGAGCRIDYDVILGLGTPAAEVFKASIYGARKAKLTTEQDSIYGLAMDGHLALHEEEVVIVDDGEGTLGGRFTVYCRGQAQYAEILENAQMLAAKLRR